MHSIHVSMVTEHGIGSKLEDSGSRNPLCFEMTWGINIQTGCHYIELYLILLVYQGLKCSVSVTIRF